MNAAPDNPASPPPPNTYEVRPDGDGFALVSDVLENRRLFFTKEHVAVGYATLHSRSRASVVRVYNATGQLLATYRHPPAKPAASPD